MRGGEADLSDDTDDTFSEGELPPLDKPPPRLSCEIIDLTEDVIIEVTEDDIDLSCEGVTHFRAATSVAHAAEAEATEGQAPEAEAAEGQAPEDQASVPESGSSEDEASVSGAVVEEPCHQAPQQTGPTDDDVHAQLGNVPCKPLQDCQCNETYAVPPFVLVLMEDNPDHMVLVQDGYIRMVPY